MSSLVRELNIIAMVYAERLILKHISTNKEKSMLHCKDKTPISEIEPKGSFDPRKYFFFNFYHFTKAAISNGCFVYILLRIL